MFPSAVISVKNEDDFYQIKQQQQAILLCFSADWCSPCRAMEATLMNTAFELEGIAKVLKVDPKTCPRLVQDYKIKSIPAFVAITTSEAFEVFYGIQTIQNLVAKFKN